MKLFHGQLLESSFQTCRLGADSTEIILQNPRQNLQGEDRGKTYRALKKKTSHVKIGNTGKKNCLVIGISSARIRSDAAPVLINGPGAWLMDKEKMAIMIRIRYCPS